MFRCLLLLGIVSSPLMAVAAESQPAQDAEIGSSPTSDSVAGLRDILTKGLRARLPSEFAFVDKVIHYVKLGKLSRRMVLETYRWARRKVGLARDELGRYPFPYFRRAMKIRAAKVGVIL